MVESRPRYKEFESLVADIFRAEGFEVHIFERLRPGPFIVRSPDLILFSKSHRKTVVEVKLFRSRQLSPSTLVAFAAYAEEARRTTEADWAVLVTTTRVAKPYRDGLVSENPRLVIYDLNALRFIAARHPELLSRLDDLLRHTLIIVEPLEPDESPKISTAELDKLPKGNVTATRERPTARGNFLCEQIRKVKAGKQGAREFEKRVEDALKYIFETDLTAWSTQPVSDSGMNRYDTVARVSSTEDVWKMIREQFHSQYVIFEYKNYSGPIKQGEIYTTEKYLYQRALRAVAFVVSRKHAHKSALSAARGALREHGKLIVNLSIDDICGLLHLRDADEDYNGVLFDKIDEMLLKLER